MSIEYAVTKGEGTLIDYGVTDEFPELIRSVKFDGTDDDLVFIITEAKDDTTTGE